MATTGYSYFNRTQIRQVAESIPGKTTELFSQIAKKHEMYIVIGLPEYDNISNLFYNSAVLIDPNGEISGIYRKHSQLMESSWCALGFGQIPVFETIYGKVALLICADVFYSELSAQASSKETKFLILPTNGGVNIDLLRARALEGHCHVILSNRYGSEKEYLNSIVPESFNEETLTINPPFYYDFQDGKSVVVDSEGKIRLNIEEPCDMIGYCDLSVETMEGEKILRRPKLYSLLMHNTLDPYSIKCMKLPSNNISLVAASDLKSKNSQELAVDIRVALQNLENNNFTGKKVKLVVFPANILTVSHSEIELIIDGLKNLAKKYDLDFIMGFREFEDKQFNSTSYLFTNDQKCFNYKKLHKLTSENAEVGEHFFVINRDYGRIAIVQDYDLWIPETSKVLGKMGVDIVAVSADVEDELMRIFCRVRSSDYLHIVMANQKGFQGIYAGGFRIFPSFKEENEAVMMELDTAHVREKKELKLGPDPRLIFNES